MDHLLGDKTLGVYSTSPENTCKWLCFDVDSEQEVAFNRLRSWLSNNGLHGLRESVRPGRSGHLWYFFDKPLPSDKVFWLGDYGRKYANLECEIFPKQASIKPGQTGNLVRLPLGEHQKPSANRVRGYFYDCPSEVELEQLLWFLEQPVNSGELVLEFIRTLPAPPVPKKRRAGQRNGKAIADELPEWEWVEQPSGEWIGPCPTCLNCGFDRQRNNLSFKPDEGLLYCHRNGGEHSFKQIMSDFKAHTVLK